MPTTTLTGPVLSAVESPPGVFTVTVWDEANQESHVFNEMTRAQFDVFVAAMNASQDVLVEYEPTAPGTVVNVHPAP